MKKAAGSRIPAPRPWLLLLLLLGLVAAAGWRCARAPFVLDDLDQMAHVQTFTGLPDCLGPDAYGLVRPVKNLLFYAVSCAGPRAVPAAHAVSLALALAAVCVVYCWFRIWFRSPYRALAAAAVWALAPTQVSSLAWFSCANILVSAIGVTGALCLWESARRSFEQRRTHAGTRATAAAVLAFVGAFYAYEAAVVFPALALLQDTARRRELCSRSARAGYLALAVLTAVLVFAPRGGTVTVPENPGLCVPAAGQLSAASAWFTLDHLAWWLFPFGRQELLGTFVWGRSATTLQLTGAWLVLSAIGGAALLLLRRRPRIAVGLAWFPVAFLPMSNLLPLRTGPTADYYLVLPSVGLSLVLVSLVGAAVRRARAPGCPRTAAAVLWLLVLAVAAWRLAAAGAAIRWTGAWRDPALLYRRALLAQPDNFRARANLARVLKLHDRPDEAEEHARAALAAAPWYTLPYHVLGDVAGREGDHAAARAWYEKALDAAPGDAYAQYALAYTAETWLNDPETARLRYSILVEAGPNPYRLEAILNLARLYAVGGDPARAAALLRRSLAQYPHSAALHHNLAVACRELGLHDEAAHHRRKAAQLQARP